jgi:hypothetical protein
MAIVIDLPALTEERDRKLSDLLLALLKEAREKRATGKLVFETSLNQGNPTGTNAGIVMIHR